MGELLSPTRALLTSVVNLSSPIDLIGVEPAGTFSLLLKLHSRVSSIQNDPLASFMWQNADNSDKGYLQNTTCGEVVP